VNYRFDSEAKEEYRRAIHFYGKAAERFFDVVESVITRIRNAPSQFREIEPGVRVCRVPNFPYSIYYLVEASEIIVVAVKHDRSDPDYWRHRVP
jgi:plasmid stabilization system protein ParE